MHVPRAEVGQGITTAMGIIAAEELDARLDRRRRRARRRPPRAAVEPAHRRLELGALALHADAHRRGSGARPVGHRGRATFGVGASTLTTRDSTVVAPTAAPRPTGRCRPPRRGSPCPRSPARRRTRRQFTLIGQPTTRLDARDIVTGKAQYALDLPVAGGADRRGPPADDRRDGARRSTTRSPARCPASSASPGSRPASRSRRRRSTRRRRRATRCGSRGTRARTPRCPTRRSAPSCRRPRRRSSAPPLGVLSVDRTFDFAFAPHAPLEVHTCVADVRADRAEIWYGAKSPIIASQQVAAAVGLPADKVTLHVVRAAARSATACSSSPRSRPRRCRRRSAARSS